MKTITQSGSILALAFLLFACGSNDNAGQTSTSTPDNDTMEQMTEEGAGLLDDAIGGAREMGGEVVDGVIDDTKAVAADAFESAKGSAGDAVSSMTDQATSAAQEAAQDAATDMAQDAIDDAIEDPEEALKKFTRD